MMHPMRLSSLGLVIFLIVACARPAAAQEADERCYELRTYTAPEGRLDDLDRRFRKYSRTIFAKYHMDRVGFWIPMDNPDNEYVYMLSYPECADRDPAWDNFLSDAEWQHINAITTAEDDVVTDVEYRMLQPTDFSPTVGPSAREHPRVFELRTYTAAPGKLEDLLTRFRDHTMELFQKHGMTNVGYWLPIDNEANQLVYLLAFPSQFARNESWEEFKADPEWQAAYEASRQDGPLVERVESIMLQPTDYSPIK